MKAPAGLFFVPASSKNPAGTFVCNMRRIIDKRKKEKFMLDDAYLNGQAKVCGWQATLVYIALCRHASKSQEAFPSIKTMMDKLGVSRNTILKGLSNLERHKVIEIHKTRAKNGKWLNNMYVLLDKSVWKTNQVPDKDTDNQVPVELTPSPSQVNTKSLTGTLRKHIEGNTSKETHLAGQSPAEVARVLEVFNPLQVRPIYDNTTQRKAVSDLIGKFGVEKTWAAAQYAVSILGKKYAPQITTPCQLRDNFARLVAYKKQEGDNKYQAISV